VTFDFNVNALIAYLREKDVHPELQKETGQVFVLYNIQGYEVPLFFLLHEESLLLQIITYLPFRVLDKTLADTARLLHILNRDLDMPGFGIDESEKLIFYRSVIPAIHHTIDAQVFAMYLATSRVACTTFLRPIGMIVSGVTSLDVVLKEIKPS
jgi:hypothetical protein